MLFTALFKEFINVNGKLFKALKWMVELPINTQKAILFKISKDEKNIKKELCILMYSNVLEYTCFKPLNINCNFAKFV